VGFPPQQITEALNQSEAAQPGKWAKSIEWWNKIVEAYKKAGCGDA
jgi:hypothetical protein